MLGERRIIHSPQKRIIGLYVINLSSLLVGELKDILENVPEDYEVIMEIRTGCDTKAGTSIAYINGVRRDEEFKEIKLMN